MANKKYLIACFDPEDKQREMKRIYQLLAVEFFPRSNFIIDLGRSSISNASLEFVFRSPEEIQHMNPLTKFAGVGQSSIFRECASYDTKNGYKYFEKKQRGRGRNGILQKLSVTY